MKKNVILILFLMISGVVSAQQEPQISHNMFNNMAINPGYTGIKGAICATGIVRQQWVGFEDADGNKGAPQTFLISIDAPVNLLRGGLGLTLMQDKLGFEKNTILKLNYAYHLHIGPGKLGLGLEAKFLNKEIDFDKFKPIEPNDYVLQSGSKEKAMITDFSFGAFYDIPNKLYFGISSSQLSEAKTAFGADLANVTLKRHYYVTAGYYYLLPPNPSFKLIPSILLKSDGAVIQFDINTLLEYNNRFWGGVTYRNQDAIVILLGLKPFTSGPYENLKIGYAYDITTSAIGSNKRSSGSHEIMIGYCFKIEVEHLPQSYKNVRFL